MSDITLRPRTILASYRSGIVDAAPNAREFKSEILRKSIHFLIGLSPLLAGLNYPVAVTLLLAGVLGYIHMEGLRLAGFRVPLVSFITSKASRPRDRGRFVRGPVTLGLGALGALLIYPLPAASIAIYALAFGDGFASLVGKFWGRLRPGFLRGKSLEGCAACFCATLFAAYQVSRDYRVALAAAFAAAVTEALPLEDYDNLALPLVVGLVVGAVSRV
ncbi:MAG: phosphatidate cytidylyltransferase [Treponema sp.]|jgi:dolichol kinase|nr:phosphatidate cytidylyltransferase [Treponema sp.]